MGERKGMGEEDREDRKEQNKKKVCASICEERPRTWRDQSGINACVKTGLFLDCGGKGDTFLISDRTSL